MLLQLERGGLHPIRVLFPWSRGGQDAHPTRGVGYFFIRDSIIVEVLMRASRQVLAELIEDLEQETLDNLERESGTG